MSPALFGRSGFAPWISRPGRIEPRITRMTRIGMGGKSSPIIQLASGHLGDLDSPFDFSSGPGDLDLLGSIGRPFRARGFVISAPRALPWADIGRAVGAWMRA